MTKQVTVASAVQDAKQNGNSNLFISVNTFDAEGKTVGERIVDMFHYGTRNWLQNHLWWAMHHNHQVECTVCTPEQSAEYVKSASLALAAKFNAPVAAPELATA